MVEEKPKFTWRAPPGPFVPLEGQVTTLTHLPNVWVVLLFKALGGGWRNRSAAKRLPGSASGATWGSAPTAAQR
jgi:hypothetical protein